MSKQQEVPPAVEQDGLPKSVPSMDMVIADVLTSQNPSRVHKAALVVTIKGLDINTGKLMLKHLWIYLMTHIDPLPSPILMSQARLQGKTLISG